MIKPASDIFSYTIPSDGMTTLIANEHAAVDGMSGANNRPIVVLTELADNPGLSFDDDIYSRILTKWDADNHNVAQDWQYLSHEDMWHLLPENSKFPLYLSEDEYPFALKDI